jgi:hypothetical protein
MKKSKISLAVGVSIALSSLLPVSIANADNVYRMSFGATNSGIQIINDPLFFKDTSLSKQEEYDSEWLTFLRQETGQDIPSIDSLNYSRLSLSLGTKSFDDASLPSGPLNIQTPYALNIIRNNFTNLNFLRTTTVFRGNAQFNTNSLKNVNGLLNLDAALGGLYLHRNQLQQVLGLEKLTSVSGALDLSENPKLSTLDGMGKLEYVGQTLNLSKNPALVDLTGISALSYVGGIIYVDNVAQYTATPKAESIFCKSLVSGDINITDTENKVINFGELCSDVEPWVTFMHSYDQLTNLANMSEWKTKTGNARLYDKNLTDEDLPSGPILSDTIRGLNFSANNISHVDFLSNVVTAIGSLNLNYSPNLENIDGLSSLQSVNGLFLREPSLLSNIDGLSALRDINSLVLHGAPLLTNVDGLSDLQSITALWLYDNALENINGLSALSTVGHSLDLKQNPKLSDISGISNLSSITQTGNESYAYFDNPSQYTVKPVTSSPFCQGLLSGGIRARDNVDKDINYGSICEGSEDWIAFMHGYDQLTNLGTMSQWETKSGTAYLQSKSLTDADLPSGPILSDTIRGLYLGANNISHANFLSNVVTATDTLDLSRLPNLENIDGLSALQSGKGLYLHSNPLLSNIDSLSSLQSVETLNLYNNPLLTNIDGLSALQSVSYLRLNDNETLENINGLSALSSTNEQIDFRRNPKLIDISGIANLAYTSSTSTKNYVYFDDPSQYTVKPVNSSPFCQGLLSGNVSARDDSNKDINYGTLCEGVEDWIAFMHGYDELTTLSTMSDWKAKGGSVYLISKGITDADLPLGPIPSDTLHSLNLGRNNISHVDFLSNAVTANSTLSINLLPNLENIDGLSALQSAQTLNINSNTLLRDVDGLSSLKSVRYLGLHHNPKLENINGLSALTTIESSADFSANPQLSDISGIANLSAITNTNLYDYAIFDHPSQYTTKPVSSSPFCQGVLSGDIRAKDNSDNNINYGSICQGVEDWIAFMHNYDQLTNLGAMSDWKTKSGSANLSYKGIKDADLPSGPILSDTIRGLNISNNSYISNVDFLSNVVTSMSTLRLVGLGQMEHLDGLSALQSADNLHISGNRSLSNINGLSSLQSANSLYLKNNLSLSNIDGLSSLQSVSHLNMHNNPLLSNVDGLSALKTADYLDLYNNETLTDINGLSALSTVGNRVDFRQNPQLMDISGISNVSVITSTSDTSYAYFDRPSQYTVKPVVGSPFCQGLASGAIRAKWGTTYNVYYGSICEGAEEWITFMHDNGFLGDMTTLSDWRAKGGSVALQRKGLSDEMMPSVLMNTDYIGSLNLDYNLLTNLDFLSNVVTAQGAIHLANMPDLQSIDGLSKITSFSNLDLRGNNSLLNLNGLSSLNTIQYTLHIESNPNLTDISGLSNLAVNTAKHTYYGLFIDDPSQYTVKPVVGSPFCDGLLSGDIEVKKNGYTRVKYDELCN